jgi:hypothetical protein
MTVRDERADAIEKLNRLFLDDFRAAQAALLDKLDAIDAAHAAHAAPGPIRTMLDDEVTDEDLAELCKRLDSLAAARAGLPPAEPPAAPAKPAPRRRTTR